MRDRGEFPRQVGSLNSCSRVRKENFRKTNLDHIFGTIPIKFIVLPFLDIIFTVLTENKTVLTLVAGLYWHEDDLSLQTDLKHLQSEQVCHCSAGLCTQFPLCESANAYNTQCRSATFTCCCFFFYFRLPQTARGHRKAARSEIKPSSFTW